MFPLIPSPQAGQIYRKMKKQPNFDDEKHAWRAKGVSEFHATGDKPLMELEFNDSNDLWPVYGGSSFNLWEPDSGNRYAWIKSENAINHLYQKRKKQTKTKSSAFFGLDQEFILNQKTLDILKPRIAFRGITNRTNTRTVIVSLVPPNTALSNSCPYITFRGDAKSEAFLLGVMSSIPFDWASRRIVEVNLNLFLLNSLPVPDVSENSSIKKEIQFLSGRLAAVDERYSNWAREVGVEVGSVHSEKEKEDIIYRIDALVAFLYGLDTEDIKIIFETFHSGWDYKNRLNNVISHLGSINESA